MPRMVALLVTLAALATAAPASAVTVTVSTPADVVNSADGLCSLREAIKATSLNSPSGVAAGECPAGNSVLDDAVNVPAGTYQLAIAGARENASATGDLDILQSVTITGAGSATTIVDGGDLDRVLQITGGTVSISGVTFRNGTAPSGFNDQNKGGEHGGGIHNAASLTLTDVVVSDNRAGAGWSSQVSGDPNPGGGGWGGGIFTTGSLTLANIIVSGNVTGDGGDASQSGNAAGGGSGGNGGGIAAWEGAAVTIVDGVVETNRTGAGRGGGSDNLGGGGGSGGSGGGIFANGALSIADSALRENVTANGGPGGSGSPYQGGGGGSGGSGGGISHTAGMLTITDSDITGNATGSGHASNSGGDSGHGGAGGGAHVASSSNAVLTRVNVSDNATGAGGAGSTYSFGGPLTYVNPQTGGPGGGIAAGAGATLTLESSTVTGNTTGNGGAGTGTGGATGGLGAGVYGGGTTTAVNTTVTDNEIGTTASGTGAPLNIPNGAGVYSEAGATTTVSHATITANRLPGDGLGEQLGASGNGMTLRSSIVVGLGAISCRATGGAIVDGGANVAFAGSGCPGVDGDPKLTAPADNGGRTLTMLPGVGSAALDIAPSAGCPAFDQRGLPRPQGTACDAGAVEVFVTPSTRPVTGTEEPPPATGGIAPPATGGTTPPAATRTPVTTAPAKDTTGPAVTFRCAKRRLATALRRGVTCSFRTSEVGRARIRAGRVCAGAKTITTSGSRSIRCTFTKKARRTLRRARRARLALVLVVTDRAGNATRRTVRIVLKR